jgi:hypothetical protein
MTDLCDDWDCTEGRSNINKCPFFWSSRIKNRNQLTPIQLVNPNNEEMKDLLESAVVSYEVVSSVMPYSGFSRIFTDAIHTTGRRRCR